MGVNDIPLLMYGTKVGLAHINDDGTIDLEIEAPCQLGIDWITEFAAGKHDAITISPTISPAWTKLTAPQPL